MSILVVYYSYSGATKRLAEGCEFKGQDNLSHSAPMAAEGLEK